MLVAATLGCADDALVIRTVSEYKPTVPVAGVQVQVDDLPWVETDASGEARFEAVASPYTVRLYQTATGRATGAQLDDAWVLIEQRDDPLVVGVDDAGIDSNRRVVISGSVIGLANEPDARIIGLDAGPDDSFEVSHSWNGPSPHQHSLRALQADQAEPPQRYMGFATLDMNVEAPLVTDPQSPGTHTGVSLEFAPVQQFQVTGRVTVPASMAVSVQANLSLVFDARSQLQGEQFLLGVDPLSGPSATFDYVFPEVPGARARLALIAGTAPGPRGRAVREFALPSSDVDFQLAEPVQLVEPADQASVPADVTLRWTEAPTGADRYTVSLRCTGMRDGVSHLVNFRAIETRATQASLPTMPGLELTPGTMCDWYVQYQDPTSLDEVVSYSAIWTFTLL